MEEFKSPYVGKIGTCKNKDEEVTEITVLLMRFDNMLMDGEFNKTIDILEQSEREKEKDLVEVTRCKDCKWFRRWVNTDITFCDLTESNVFEEDFCSRYERINDE